MKTIGKRAFADCPNLTALVIPATVETIDDTAIQGSINVTVNGEAGSDAQRFAEASNIPFVDINAETQPAENVALRPPVALPYVPFNG